MNYKNDVCILSYSCLKVHKQNKLLLLIKSESMSELICMSNVSCIFNSEACKITNLINKLIVIQYKQMLNFIYT